MVDRRALASRAVTQGPHKTAQGRRRFREPAVELLNDDRKDNLSSEVDTLSDMITLCFLPEVLPLRDRQRQNLPNIRLLLQVAQAIEQHVYLLRQ
jgi:hypothetical protein